MEMTELRTEIDRLDAKITDLVCRRMDLCGRIAGEKQKHHADVLDTGREREILTRVGKLAGEPLDVYLRVLYSVMFDISRSYQTALMGVETELERKIKKAVAETGPCFPRQGTVACPGAQGTCFQAAADRFFSRAEVFYFSNFERVVQAVDQGLCDYGVLPIESGAGASLDSIYDLMHRYGLHIVRSTRLHTSAEGNALPYDLEAPADQARGGVKGGTPFVCIARGLEIYPGSDRVSLMLSLPHTSGALYRMIAQFAALDLNLTKLESRPIAGNDLEYLLYIDLEASVWSDEVVSLLGECSASGRLFNFLGGYREI
jgi:chorismate mutase/prephenate dehydratase